MMYKRRIHCHRKNKLCHDVHVIAVANNTSSKMLDKATKQSKSHMQSQMLTSTLCTLSSIPNRTFHTRGR